MSNHHFVPQFYFRRFTGGRPYVSCLKVSDGSQIERASIKGQASRQMFYVDEEIEKGLMQADGVHAQVLRGVDRTGPDDPISEERYFDLLTFVTLQNARTSYRRRRIENDNNQLVRELTRMDVEAKKDTPNREEILAQLDQLSVDARGFHLKQIASFGVDAILLTDLELCVLQNRTATPFVFSDDPIVLFNQFLEGVRHRGVVGLVTPGLQISFPIGPDKAIFFFDPGVYSGRCRTGMYLDVTEQRDVDHLNKLQVHSAVSMIYFGTNDQYRYVRTLWRQERGNRRSAEPRLQIFGSGNDRLLVSTEPRIGFDPKFSFVEYEPQDPATYHFRRRSSELESFARQERDNLFGSDATDDA